MNNDNCHGSDDGHDVDCQCNGESNCDEDGDDLGLSCLGSRVAPSHPWGSGWIP